MIPKSLKPTIVRFKLKLKFGLQDFQAKLEKMKQPPKSKLMLLLTELMPRRLKERLMLPLLRPPLLKLMLKLPLIKLSLTISRIK